ncbi:MAG: chemotaxis protein CheW [Gammaproteobacteria bacterium]|nr:chemotaxis protein CheW [Gammaproteobacteria bacterium]
MSQDNIVALQAVDDEDAGTQYLTFMLADEQYGLNILQVQEIRGWEQVTRIPNAPAYLRGVINLRGTIVPVLDLRRRFDMPVAEYTKETVVIVVHAADPAGGERSLGLVVDAVSDVLVAQDDDVASTPDFGANVPTENILGLVNADGHMVMLLDVGSLLETDRAVGGDA